MEKTLTLIAACALALNAHAQPTLTFASNAPTVGTQYTLNYGNYVAPGNAGANQVWNLSGLTSDSTDVLQMVAPSSTTHGDEFPNATIAELSSPVTTYYQASASGLYFSGSDDGTSLIVNAPAPKYIAFPCTMGSSWSTPIAAEFSYEEDMVYRTGAISCEADGYGTLTMPWGATSNVLRIHMQNVMQDSMELFTMDYTYDSYLYYVAGQSYPIAELVTATIDFGFGDPQVVQFSRWTGETSTSITDASTIENTLNVYPNPSNGVVNVALTDDMGANTYATVLDATGRIAHQQRPVVVSENTAQLELHHLAPGIYTLMITDRKGKPFSTRISLR